MNFITNLVEIILKLSIIAFVISMFLIVFNMDIGLIIMIKSSLIILGTIMLDLLISLRR